MYKHEEGNNDTSKDWLRYAEWYYAILFIHLSIDSSIHHML